MMAAVHNNNSNPLQCHEHVQLYSGQLSSWEHSNSTLMHQSPHIHCTVLENFCYYLCVHVYWVVTLTMSSAVIVMRLHDKGIEIDLPKIMVLMYITNPIHPLTNHPLTIFWMCCSTSCMHSPGLCDHPPSLLRVEPHTLGHIVPEGRER